MKYHNGFYWPDTETHLIGLQETYQREVYDRAMGYVNRKIPKGLGWRRVAIDVGAHVGIFTARMLQDFDDVFAFEPCVPHLDCLRKNAPEANIVNAGLSDRIAGVVMHTPGMDNTGHTMVTNDEGSTLLMPLDKFYFPYADTICLIKIDVEGHELQVIKGAQETIWKHLPIFIIEQKGHGGNVNVTAPGDFLLNNMNYKLYERVGNDYIYGP